MITPQPTDGSDRGFWSSVREALKGSHQDFTTGNLNRAILLLAIPMVLEMVLESLFAVTDVFWVGRLGANAVATVGITESMLALVFAIGLGVVVVDDGDGGAADRREGSRGRGDCRRAGDRSRAGDLAGARDSGGDLCAGIAARDGRFAGDCGERVRVCANCAGWLRRNHHALPE